MRTQPMTPRQTDVYRIYERHAMDGKWPTLSEVAREMKISKPTLVEMIVKLVGKGYLVRVGEGRAVKYRIPDVCPTCGAKGASPERIEAIRVTIGAALHSALRTSVDSPESHRVWKGINDLSNEEWAVVTREAATEAFAEFISGAQESLNGDA